jgi:hypothetical protein
MLVSNRFTFVKSSQYLWITNWLTSQKNRHRLAKKIANRIQRHSLLFLRSSDQIDDRFALFFFSSSSRIAIRERSSRASRLMMRIYWRIRNVCNEWIIFLRNWASYLMFMLERRKRRRRMTKRMMNNAKMFHKCFANVMRIFCECCVSDLRMLCECFANVKKSEIVTSEWARFTNEWVKLSRASERNLRMSEWNCHERVREIYEWVNEFCKYLRMCCEFEKFHSNLNSKMRWKRSSQTTLQKSSWVIRTLIFAYNDHFFSDFLLIFF